MTPALPEGFLARPFAHRGLHDAAVGVVENSAAAIAAAAEAGYGIELDVQLSADDVAMVFHDPTLDRLTGETGPVAARDAAGLGRIALAGAADDGTIPTLPQVLEIVAGRVPVLVEMKDQTDPTRRSRGDGNARLAAAVARALDGHAGPVAVMSFAADLVTALAAAAPGVPCGLTTGDARAAALGRGMALAGRIGFVSHDWRGLSCLGVGGLRAAGVPILCWTVRAPWEAGLARRVADQITFEGFRPA
jgi:glycerophosphoryl diester phosphodiesterase